MHEELYPHAFPPLFFSSSNFIYFMFYCSGIANSVVKTEVPASNTGSTVDYDVKNSSTKPELDTVNPINTATIENVPSDALKEASSEISEVRFIILILFPLSFTIILYNLFCTVNLECWTSLPNTVKF